MRLNILKLTGLVFVMFFLATPITVFAEACATYSASSCPDKPGMEEFPDGPSVTACPNNGFFDGCSNKPKSGTGVVLCCQNTITGSSGTQCGPPAGVKDTSYLCLTKDACKSAGGDEVLDIKPPEIACSNSSEVCCRSKSRSGTTVQPTAGTASAKPTVNYTLQNPLGNVTSLSAIMGNVIKTFLGIVGALALLVFAYGGIVWMTARGDAGQVKTAQGAIKNGIIGLFVIAFAYSITSYFVKMLTTEYVPGVSSSSRAGGSEAPTQAQTEQTSLDAQQKTAADAEKAAADAAKTQVKTCPTGYSCYPTNSVNPDNLKFCQQSASGNSEECGTGAYCCNFNQ